MTLRKLGTSKSRIFSGFVAAVFSGGITIALFYLGYGGVFSAIVLFFTTMPESSILFAYVAGWTLFHCVPLYAVLLAGRWTSIYHIVGAAVFSNMTFFGARDAINYWILEMPDYPHPIAGATIELIIITTGALAFWLVAHADYSVLYGWFRECILKNALKMFSVGRRMCRATYSAMEGKAWEARPKRRRGSMASRFTVTWMVLCHFGRPNIRVVAGFIAGIVAAAVYVSWTMAVMDSSDHAVKTRVPFVDAFPAALIGMAIVTLVLYLPLYLVARIGRWTCLHHIVIWPYIVNHTFIGIIVTFTAMGIGYDAALHEVKEGLVQPTKLSRFEEILANAYVIPGALAFWLIAHADCSGLRLRASRGVSACMSGMRLLVRREPQLVPVAFARREADHPSPDGSPGRSGAAGPSSQKRTVLLMGIGVLAYLLGAAGWEGIMWAREEMARMASPFWHLYK